MTRETLHKGSEMNRRFGWMIDPEDDTIFVHDEREQIILDKIARYRTNGVCTWLEAASIMTTMSGRHIGRPSAIAIMTRERPGCLHHKEASDG